MWVLWGSFVAAPVMLFGVATVLFGFDPSEFYFAQGAQAAPPLIGWVFLGISVLGLVTVPVIRRAILRASPPSTDSLPPVTVPGEPGVPSGAMGRVFSAWIVSIAIAEAGALLGFVLAVTTGNSADMLPALVIYLVFVAVLMPTHARIGEWMSAGADNLVPGSPVPSERPPHETRDA
jgi:hypothetical protein